MIDNAVIRVACVRRKKRSCQAAVKAVTCANGGKVEQTIKNGCAEKRPRAQTTKNGWRKKLCRLNLRRKDGWQLNWTSWDWGKEKSQNKTYLSQCNGRYWNVFFWQMNHSLINILTYSEDHNSWKLNQKRFLETFMKYKRSLPQLYIFVLPPWVKGQFEKGSDCQSF